MNTRRPEALLSRLLRPQWVPCISRKRDITASLGNLFPLQPPALWNCFFLPDWKSLSQHFPVTCYPFNAGCVFSGMTSELPASPSGPSLFPHSCCSSQAAATHTLLRMLSALAPMSWRHKAQLVSTPSYGAGSPPGQPALRTPYCPPRPGWIFPG